jgi:hypothetical protein
MDKPVFPGQKSDRGRPAGAAGKNKETIFQAAGKKLKIIVQ